MPSRRHNSAMLDSPRKPSSTMRIFSSVGLHGGCSSRSAQTAIQDARISVSSPLLGGYDEPEILRSSSRKICLIGADVGQDEIWHVSVTGPEKYLQRDSGR